MKKWILKALVQKIISYLPFPNRINYIFQKYVTKGVYLTDEYFYDRLLHAREHLSAYARFSGKELPSTCLELGTGWYPVVPIAFFLSGADKVYSVDISFLTSRDRIKTTLDKFMEAEGKGKLQEYLSCRSDRMQQLRSLLNNYEELTLQEILERLQLIYLVEDARKLSLPNDSVDLVNSNNTFEHIYPGILIPILKDFKRVVNKDHGVMSHFIDMSDHFAHFDHSINIYNFLQFTDKQWKNIDNSIQPQSRLRIDDYKSIYSLLKIPVSAESFRPGNQQELAKVKLSSQFKGKDKSMLAISHCHFVSAMKA